KNPGCAWCPRSGCPPLPCVGKLVRAEGVEPPHLAILEPKSSASTSSATRAALEGRAPITGMRSSATRQPFARGARCRAEESHFDATASAISRQSRRAANHAVARPARAVATRPADRAAAGEPSAGSRYRRAGAALAGHHAKSGTDLTGRLRSFETALTPQLG